MSTAEIDPALYPEPAMIETSLKCRECAGTGEVLCRIQDRPWDEEIAGCSACHGRGEIVIEFCEKCARTERECKCFQEWEQREQERLAKLARAESELERVIESILSGREAA